jgi:acyl-CoA thioester hydrolase
MEHECRLVVRSYECDMYGHVNNAVYLNYLELARHAYLRDNGVVVQDLHAAGHGLLIARLAIDYRRPAVMDDELLVSTRPVRKGRVGGVLAQRITRAGELVAEAEVTWVCVDARGRPSRLPAGFDSKAFTP